MNNNWRNWSDLRVFLAVIRAGSTLAASRELDMSQPTVARRIDVLEHESGLILFERDKRGFHPTQAGRALIPLAEAMEAAAHAFVTKVQTLSGPAPIRITAYSGTFSPRVASIFSEFSRTHPEVSFEFLPDVKVLNLLKGEADIALRISRSAPDPELIQRRISTPQYALYGSQEYAARHGLPASRDDLSGHHFVSYLRDGVAPALHDWLTRHVAAGQITNTFSEIDLMHAAIRSGQGLGLINVALAKADPTLLPCFEPIPELAAEHLLLISPEAYRRPEIRAFVSFFAPRYAAIFK